MSWSDNAGVASDIDHKPIPALCGVLDAANVCHREGDSVTLHAIT
jgi:hypothetical protein